MDGRVRIENGHELFLGSPRLFDVDEHVYFYRRYFAVTMVSVKMNPAMDVNTVASRT